MSESLRPHLDYLAGHLFSFFRAPARARAAYEAAVKAAPDMAGAWRCLGFLYQTAGQGPQAIEALERALALDPDDAVSAFNLGFILQQRGEDERALELFEQAVKLRPNLDRAWFGIGLIRNKRREFAAAADALAEAARLQPFNPHAAYHLAAAFHGLGDGDKAAAETRRIAVFDPGMAARMRQDFGIPP